MRYVNLVGMRRFELPAPRPPDVYSNLAELHPENEEANIIEVLKNYKIINKNLLMELAN